jgi:hypothetical protein
MMFVPSDFRFLNFDIFSDHITRRKYCPSHKALFEGEKNLSFRLSGSGAFLHLLDQTCEVKIKPKLSNAGLDNSYCIFEDSISRPCKVLAFLHTGKYFINFTTSSLLFTPEQIL